MSVPVRVVPYRSDNLLSHDAMTLVVEVVRLLPSHTAGDDGFRPHEDLNTWTGILCIIALLFRFRRSSRE